MFKRRHNKQYTLRWCRVVWGFFLVLLLIFSIATGVYLFTYFLNIADPNAKVVTYSFMLSKLKSIGIFFLLVSIVIGGLIGCLALLMLAVEAFQKSKIRILIDD